MMVVVTRMWRKSTRRLYERERERQKTQNTPRATANGRPTIVSKRARAKVVVDARRLLPSTQRTHTYLLVLFSKSSSSSHKKEGRKERPDKRKKEGPKNTPKKRRERGEKI